jgi:hypothetical protein
MLQKLDEMYEQEEHLIREMQKLTAQYKQLQEDKELLQQMIMHQSNKINRGGQYGNLNKNKG